MMFFRRMSNPYEAALTTPFNPKAFGARVPDAHSIPTNIYSVRQIWEIAVNNPAGNFDFIVSPCPYDTIITSLQATTQTGNVLIGPNVNAFGSKVPNAVGPQGTTPFGFPKFGNGPGVNYSDTQPSTVKWSGSAAGIVTETALTSFLADFRVVSFGVRMRSLLPALQQSGSILYGSIPCTPLQPPSEYSSYDEWLDLCDFPPKDAASGVMSTGMINLPIHDAGSYGELTQEGGMEWCGRICGPDAFKFRDSQIAPFLIDAYETSQSGSNFLLTTSVLGGGTAKWGGDIGTASAQFAEITGNVAPLPDGQPPDLFVKPNGTSVAQTRGLDPYNTSGWTALLVRGSGVGVVTGSPPPSEASPVSVIQVEVVFHFEGTAAIVNNALVAGASVGVYNNAQFVRAVERASRERWFKRVVDYDDRPNTVGVAATRKKRRRALTGGAYAILAPARMGGGKGAKRKRSLRK